MEQAGKTIEFSDSTPKVMDDQSSYSGPSKEEATQGRLIASETRYRRLFEAAQDGILILDALTGRIVDVNPYLVQMLGYPTEHFIGQMLWELGLLEDKEMNRIKLRELQEKDYIRYEDIPLITHNGGRVDVEFISNVYMVNGERVIQCNIRNISDRIRLEETLRIERNILSQTLNSIGDGVVSTDIEGNVVFVNRIAENLTGWTMEAAVGKPIKEIIHLIDESTRNGYQGIVQSVLKGGQLFEIAKNTLLVCKNGIEHPVEGSATPILLETGKTAGVVLVLKDCTERRRNQIDIEYFSFHDHLTGLYNRRYYDKMVEKYKDASYNPLALMMIDIDGLKLTNDAFGHKAGDVMLRKVGDVLNQLSRNGDIVARVGGDEFIFLSPKTDLLKADAIAMNIRTALAIESEDYGLLSVSIGLGHRMDGSDDLDAIYKCAEDEMYRRKLYESKSMRSKTIEIIKNTLFEKIPSEMVHSKRVGAICEAMARKMDLDADSVKSIKISGLMHDIGKIGISETILNKTASLDHEERSEIERHPEIGYRILLSVPQFSEIAECILAHHERWDGKGYPRGLQGEDIPLHARIIALADSFEAMRSDRPYRKAMSLEKAVKEIGDCAGSQFDPALAQLFIASIAEIDHIL